MKEKYADQNDYPCNEGILSRKRSKAQSQKKVSRLFINRYVHDDDEGCVEVDENSPIDVENRGLVLEENDSEDI